MKKLITIASMLSIGFTSVAMYGFVNLNRSNNSGSPHWMYEVSRVNDNVFLRKRANSLSIRSELGIYDSQCSIIER